MAVSVVAAPSVAVSVDRKENVNPPQNIVPRQNQVRRFWHQYVAMGFFTEATAMTIYGLIETFPALERAAVFAAIFGGLTTGIAFALKLRATATCSKIGVLARRILGISISVAGPFLANAAPQITSNDPAIIGYIAAGFGILGMAVTGGFEMTRCVYRMVRC